MNTPKVGRTTIAKARKAITLPEVGQTTHQLISKKYILFVHIDSDGDTSNPCEDQDGLGTIRSLSTRHINHISFEEAESLLNSDPDVVPLSYYEHGRSLWFVKDSSAPAGVEFRWDGVRFAGIWIPDDCVRESYTGQDGLTRHQWMVKQAKACCETYTDWCNGDVYYYNVQLHEARYSDEGDLFDDFDDYRFDKAIYDDSCGGFYGWEYFQSEVKDAAAAAINKLKKEQ